MNIPINYPKRIDRIRSEMAAQGIDVLIGTRMVSVTFVSGAFAPWRGAAVVTRDGYAGLVNFLIDHERVRAESWLEDISAYAPIPGMDMLDLVIHKIKELGLDKAVIGVELGHSPRGNTGFLFATEYELLQAALPEATFVNALSVVDRAAYVKDPAEIMVMRQATAWVCWVTNGIRPSATPMRSGISSLKKTLWRWAFCPSPSPGWAACAWNAPFRSLPAAESLWPPHPWL